MNYTILTITLFLIFTGCSRKESTIIKEYVRFIGERNINSALNIPEQSYIHLVKKDVLTSRIYAKYLAANGKYYYKSEGEKAIELNEISDIVYPDRSIMKAENIFGSGFHSSLPGSQANGYFFGDSKLIYVFLNVENGICISQYENSKVFYPIANFNAVGGAVNSEGIVIYGYEIIGDKWMYLIINKFSQSIARIEPLPGGVLDISANSMNFLIDVGGDLFPACQVYSTREEKFITPRISFNNYTFLIR